MLPELLIAYATRAGSTAEVAEAIATTLRQAGLAADVRPMRDVESLLGWKSVILGAPLYFGAFPSELHKFFVRHRDALQNLHPWCFVLGPTENTPKFFNASRAEAEKQFAKYPWFSPAEMRILGGKWDPKTLPFPMSLIKLLPANPIRKIPASDIRDWAAIRTWATEIAQQLQSAV